MLVCIGRFRIGNGELKISSGNVNTDFSQTAESEIEPNIYTVFFN